MRSLLTTTRLLAMAVLLPLAGSAADVEFTVPPSPVRETPSARGITICIATEEVQDLRQFEERPATANIPSLQSPRIPKDKCIARNRSLYGKGLDNILIEGRQTVQGLAADTLAAALSGMGYNIVREKAQAPADAIHAEILIDRFWGWMQVPEGNTFFNDTTSDMVGGMETRIHLSRPGGGRVTVTATGDGRARQGLRYGAAWQKMMTTLLESYMARAQERFAELDLAALDAPASPAPADEKEQLRKLKQLRDEELITEEEYQQKRSAILDRL